jgi:hypothetical protein
MGTSTGKRAKRIARRAGCAAIVCTALVTLGLSVRHEVRFTQSFVTPQEISQQTLCARWEEYVYQAVRSQVPQGATVYVHGPTHTLTIRLAELSTPWLVPQASSVTASWKLTLVPAHRGCVGLSLEARRI